MIVFCNSPSSLSILICFFSFEARGQLLFEYFLHKYFIDETEVVPKTCKSMCVRVRLIIRLHQLFTWDVTHLELPVLACLERLLYVSYLLKVCEYIRIISKRTIYFGIRFFKGSRYGYC